MKIRVGIFFGGPSREREVSFAGGRTVYDNLDKNFFEPLPIFVDSLGNFILLDWQYIYKGSIRDFHPAPRALRNLDEPYQSRFQIYIESLSDLEADRLASITQEIGQPLLPHQFRDHFDFAFLALHGPFGEDGNLQGLLEWHRIPYSGSGILPSAIGIDKAVQDEWLQANGFPRPQSQVLGKQDWLRCEDQKALLDQLTAKLGLPLVIKSPRQGSSIGVSILPVADEALFAKYLDNSFFRLEIKAQEWLDMNEAEKNQWMIRFTDIRIGLGFPIHVSTASEQTNQLIYRPEALWNYLDEHLQNPEDQVVLEAQDGESSVLIESYLEGKEFSCIVIQDEAGNPLALPPTEIRKYREVFDYRSKYLPGTSRKITPIEVDHAHIQKIRKACERLFEVLHANVYARIDGFINQQGEVFLNDPNTTSGMMPSSFFFHQAAEIGLDASQFLTYIIRTSLAERIKTGKNQISLQNMLDELDRQIDRSQVKEQDKIKVAVIMGGYSTERHISMESGRNIYEKLASSTKYTPLPIFLTGNHEQYEMYALPIHYMLKDNADDIREKILKTLGQDSLAHPVISEIIAQAQALTRRYAGTPLLLPESISFTQLSERADLVFIALHGRPGEDGSLQQELEKYGIPYNGSGVASSQVTINKYETNEILKKHGVKVAEHRLIYKKDWQQEQSALLESIEAQFDYPLIAKPADDGCSSAVKKIKNREMLVAFAEMMFRTDAPFLSQEAQVLALEPNEEFPQKEFFLIEELIHRKGARYFLEITGGLLTHHTETGLHYEVFEPSETLAQGDVLSLEEKFLAGEGQNITPAVYAPHPEENQVIVEQVKIELEKVAKILKIEGYARIDAFVRVSEALETEVIIIEINSLPGMTPATCIFHQCALNGYKPYHFIDAILNFAQERLA